MSHELTIDFISDIACPWCVVGLYSLEKALSAFPGIKAEFRLHPFELDSSTGPEGENLLQHLARKYDIQPDEAREGLKQVTQRGAQVGFTFNFTDNSRVWPTFDAHRIIRWADEQGKGLVMKKALFSAYFTHNRNTGDFSLLAELAGENGLDAGEAQQMLESGAWTEEVKREIHLWKSRGVTAVPTIRLGERQTLTGAQTVEVFEAAIRSVLEGVRLPGAPLM